MPPRLKAFVIHLGLSVLIALAVMALVFGLWYPQPMAAATGVTSIFLLLLLVDVILGPSLTLLVYKFGKKTLVMDLTVIACLQLAALIYGLYTVAEGRPAWLVFAQDRFELVRINDIDDREIGQAAIEYQNASWLGPRWVYAANPMVPETRNAILFESVFDGVDIAQRPNLYQPLEQHRDSIRLRIQPLTSLERFNSTEQVQKQLTIHPAANGWLALSANHQDMVVLMQRDSAKVVSIVDLRPW